MWVASDQGLKDIMFQTWNMKAAATVYFFSVTVGFTTVNPTMRRLTWSEPYLFL
jgi:hypothetical protein